MKTKTAMLTARIPRALLKRINARARAAKLTRTDWLIGLLLEHARMPKGEK